jgi:hypothetical protein
MFITVGEVKDLTSFAEISGLSDSEVQGYIDRADAWIRRATHRDYKVTMIEEIQTELRIATLLMVEYIYYWDNPEMKAETISHDSAVRLGSFSFTKEKANPGELTGNYELDSILESLKYSPTAGGFFNVLKRG